MQDDGGGVSAEWVDGHGVPWRVTLPPGRIVLCAARETIEIPAKEWRRDVYVAVHGSGFIVRFERFDSSVGFVVSAEQAAPLLAHLGVPPGKQLVSEAVEETTTPARPLLWPKVSPLAVWALLCSALVFVPYVGLLPAVATVVLLILHRQRVRQTSAFGNSRALCATAFVFLVLGSVVSALAIGGLREHAQGFDSDRLFSGHIAKERNWGIIGCGMFVVLLSLTVHEAAHAITAWWLGDGLARSLGRVTLNPMAHIDPFGTILLPILLITAGAPVFGYAKPVPVRVEMLPRYRRAHILIAIAGPGSNLLLACASLLLLLGLTCGLRLAVPEASVTNLASLNLEAPLAATGFALSAVFGPVCMILKLSFVINVALALFNLIPIPPLDGSWVLEHLFPNSLGRLYAALRPYGFLVFIGAVYAGVFEYMTYPFVLLVGPGLALVAAATGM
ncbi:MAG: site-2 protease family protein [Planctomycetota bacterium]